MSELDKKIKYCKPDSSSQEIITLEQVKNLYVGKGLTIDKIAEETFLDPEKIKSIVVQHQLDKVRNETVKKGLETIKNSQILQAEKLLELENNFKRLRILQLEAQLADYVAYYQRHGHFYATHPITGEVLKNSNGLAIHIKIPNVSKEISELKESVNLSAGLSEILTKIDDILNSGHPSITVDDSDIIDADFSELFSKND